MRCVTSHQTAGKWIQFQRVALPTLLQVKIKPTMKIPLFPVTDVDFRAMFLNHLTELVKPLHRMVGVRGGVVVKALRYKPAGRGFDSRWCHWNFSVT